MRITVTPEHTIWTCSSLFEISSKVSSAVSPYRIIQYLLKFLYHITLKKFSSYVNSNNLLIFDQFFGDEEPPQVKYLPHCKSNKT